MIHHTIAPAARTTPAGAVILLASFALYLAGGFLIGAVGWACVLALLPLTLLAAKSGAYDVVHAGLVLLLTGLGLKLIPVGITAAGLAAGLAAYAGLLAAVPPLRGSFTWLGRGRLGSDVWWLMAATTLVSGGALVGWTLWTRPDLSRFQGMISDVPFWLIPILILVFSAVNAAVEEAVFRGAMAQAADSAFGIGLRSLVCQAAAFGFFHLRGFPSGALGVVMATLYGLMLGGIRHRCRGLMAPWLTHIIADVVIVIILVAIGPA